MTNQKVVPGTTEPPGRGKAPSTRLRDAVFHACGQRAEHASNLWLVYSHRNRRQWIVTSDVEFLHFLYLEFASEVRQFDLRPEPIIVRVGDEDRRTTLDAIVVMANGRVQWRETKVSESASSSAEDGIRAELQRAAQMTAAAQRGAEYIRVTLADLEPHRIRIQNGLRMLRFLTASRRESLAVEANSLLARLHSMRRPQSIRELMSPTPEPARPIAHAALFELLQKGRVDIDIETKLITQDTLVAAIK